MRSTGYTKITTEVLEIYRLTRIILITWVAICFIYVVLGALYSATNNLVNFSFLWRLNIPDFANNAYLVLLNTLSMFSKTFPVFFMVLYTGLSLKASRVLVSHSVKPILIFWFVQAFNFVFIVSTQNNVFLNAPAQKQDLAISIATMMIVAFPFVVFQLLKALKIRGLIPNHQSNDIYNFILDNMTNLPHSLYIAVMSIIIALIFNMNILTGNLSISNGIAFGLGFSFLILSSEDLQRLILYFIAPDTYLEIHKELLSSRQLDLQRVKSENMGMKVRIESEDAILRAQIAKNESSSKIRELLVSANNIYIEAKRQSIEEKIRVLEGKLSRKEITLGDFSIEMEKLFLEIEAAYRNVQIKTLPKPPSNSDQN